LSREHGLSPARIVLLRPGALPVTPSGKVRRGECRALLADGRLDAVADWASPAPNTSSETTPSPTGLSEQALRAWLIARLASELGIAPADVDPAEPFARYGLDSAGSVGLACGLEAELGIELEATLFWDYPSISELARY